MAKYKLKSGTHGMPDGRMYRKDDVIESEADLTTKFVNKFERVDPQVPPSAPYLQDHAPTRPDEEPQREGFSAEVAEVLQEGATEALEPVADAKPQEAAAEPAQPRTAPTTKRLKPRDVTKHFPEAVEQDFRVTKTGKQYFVWDIDDPDEPLNAEGVTTKADVRRVIQEALEA